MLLAELQFSLQNITRNDGFGIALTGILIVFIGLILISLLIALLPVLLGRLTPLLPQAAQQETHGTAAAPSDKEAAAIAYVLHQRLKSEG